MNRYESTNSMEQSTSWEANSHSASQIPRLLWKPKVHYRVHNSLSQMHLVHIPPYFPKTHSNIILPSRPRSHEWSLPFRFCDQNVVCTSRGPYVLRVPTHLPWLNHPKYLVRCTSYEALLVLYIMLPCSFESRLTEAHDGGDHMTHVPPRPPSEASWPCIPTRPVMPKQEDTHLPRPRVVLIHPHAPGYKSHPGPWRQSIAS
jgi:hypothetical protein